MTWWCRRPSQVLVPENVSKFPEHYPLASLLLYSPGCLRRLAQLVRHEHDSGGFAYVVPGRNAGWQDRKVVRERARAGRGGAGRPPPRHRRESSR